MKKDIIKIIVSTVICVISLLLFNNMPAVKLCFLITSYLIVAYEILFMAFKNICRGDVFNENFLMSVASIGAFIIGEYFEGIAVMIFYTVGELFQNLAVERSRKSISSLMEICPDFATVIRNDEQLSVLCEEVSVGETIVIKPGERIPLDSIVKSGTTTVDTSSITGESVPVYMAEGDKILSGCINTGSVIKAQVIKNYGESTASKILELVENAQSKKAKSEAFITKFARYYTPFVVFSALIMGIVPPLISSAFTFSEQIYKALSFLVASCPCALVISVPLSFFGGMGNAARKGILIKGGNYLEALAHTKVAIFDKTGTLTHGKFEVSEIYSQSLSDEDLLEIAAYCEYYSTHPIATSIKSAYEKDIKADLIDSMEELSGSGICAVINNKKFYAGNKKLMDKMGYSEFCTDTKATIVYLCSEKEFLGYIVISDKIKEDSIDAISSLKKLGVSKTVMLTGDSSAIAESVGNQLGIDEIYSELMPQDKLSKTEEILGRVSRGDKLLYVGDGINDTPVLSRADIGIAMGTLGTDAAIDIADVVIMKDEPSKVAEAVKISKYTLKIVKQNIIFSLFVKISILILCSFSIANMWAAVFADVGVSVLAVLNAARVLKKRNFN